ncbi:MAG: tetratricopeptide repeat protein [Alphaproteobacteria bacterium]
MRISSLLVALAWLASTGVPTLADFAQGLAAYDGGDYRTAFEQWRALAEAGDAEAQTALAGLYVAGQGAPADAAAAVRWYRRAAEQGHAVAQQNLGDLYGQGRGVARDLVSAYVWLSLAAEQGQRWSARRRDQLSPQLSPEQRAEAEARLEVWRRAD